MLTTAPNPCPCISSPLFLASRDRAPIRWLAPSMSTVARAGPGRSQALRSPVWWPESNNCCFPGCTLARSCQRAQGRTGTQVLSHGERASVASPPGQTLPPVSLVRRQQCVGALAARQALVLTAAAKGEGTVASGQGPVCFQTDLEARLCTPALVRRKESRNLGLGHREGEAV